MSPGPTVLFVAGAGRSGSTLLDAMLGQIDGFVSVGELRHVWVRGFLRDETCGCGRPFGDCPFWSEVIARASLGRLEAARLRQLQRRTDRMWRVPQLARRGGSQGFRKAVDGYTRAVGGMYRAVAEVAGARVVVDSSKSPSHAYLLHAGGDLDLRVLHLVRDSRAVAFSWRRIRPRPEAAAEQMPRYPAVWTALEWDVMNAASEWTRRLGMPYARVRYEDLMARPREVLARALQALDLPAGPLTFIEGSSVRLRPGHTVSGNPSRFRSGRVELRPDLEWERTMGRAQRAVVTAMTWPLLVRYGYAGGARE